MGALHAVRSLDGPAMTRPVPFPPSPVATSQSPSSWSTATMPMRRPDGGVDGGVHLPFLAPMLCGVRVRGSRRGLEFILPNPSGGRGVYVAAWSVVTGFAAPCLHDTLLVGRLSGQGAIGPADVREAGWAVARDGYAGLEAAAAALRTQAALEAGSLRLRAQCLMTLATRGGFHGPEAAASCLARDGFNLLAARLGWRGPQLADALQTFSVRYASVAVGGSGPISARTAAEGGRWKRLLGLVQRLRLSMAEEQFSRHGLDALLLARVMAAADRCLGEVGRRLPEMEAMLADPLPLLEACRDGQRGVAGWLQALEAAFDGWDRICLLWFDAVTPAARLALIPELAALARATGSGDGWSPPGRQGDAGEMEIGPGPEQQRLLIERNERIRTQELLLDVEAAPVAPATLAALAGPARGDHMPPDGA